MRRIQWKDLKPEQRTAILAAGIVQWSLAGLALLDIRRRPAHLIRGSRPAWTAASFISFVGPLAYFAFGRRRAVPERKEAAAPEFRRRSSDGHIHGFDRTLQETHRWLNEISREMNHPSQKMAYHALRGVLSALRDRLPPENVFDLSAQLPMLIRGILFEGYRPAGRPMKFHRDEFLERVQKELRIGGGANPSKAIRAVIRVLERNVGEGEMGKIYHCLPRDLRELVTDEIAPA